MDFRNAQELLALCEEHQLPISEIMRQREFTVGESTADSCLLYTSPSPRD